MSVNIYNKTKDSLTRVDGGGSGAIAMTMAEWIALNPKPQDGTQIVITDDVSSGGGTSTGSIITLSFDDVTIEDITQGTYAEREIAKISAMPAGNYLLIADLRILNVNALDNDYEGTIGVGFNDKKLNMDIGSFRTSPAFKRDNMMNISALWESDGTNEIALNYQGHYNSKCNRIKIRAFKLS